MSDLFTPPEDFSPTRQHQRASELGATNVFIPKNNPLVISTGELTLDVRVWLEHNVGVRFAGVSSLHGSTWPGYSAIKRPRRVKVGPATIIELEGFDFFFKKKRHAVLFKLTWA